MPQYIEVRLPRSAPYRLSLQRTCPSRPSLLKALRFAAGSLLAAILLLLTAAPGQAQSQSAPIRHSTVLQRSSVMPAAHTTQSMPLRTRVHTNANVNTGAGIVYTCDANVTTAACNYLNTTVAGYYNSTFTNANADIYVRFGSTGLGSSTYYLNFVTYAQYANAYASIANKAGIQVSAQSALANYAHASYGSDSVWIQPALAGALGIEGLISGGATGITTAEGTCSLPADGCYNAIITLTNAANTFYFDDLGGTEPADEYDFYGTVQHETDEILGTSSCIATQGPLLSNGCDGTTGDTGGPSVVDLFRYSSAGNLVLNSSLSTTAGAYFSYDGGTTNGAMGSGGSAKFYNTLANGNDYADYVASTPDCSTNKAIQDATGCPGVDAGQSILNDGGSEVTILTAIGYSVPTAKPTLNTPNPATPSGVTTFSWNPGTASQFSLRVGVKYPGSDDLYDSGFVSEAVTSGQATIPTDGVDLYVRLYFLLNGTWSHIDATYTETGTFTAPAITSPVAGSSPNGSNVSFTWSAGSGTSTYEFKLGSTGPGSSDLYNGGVITTDSATVGTVPSGETLYARLYYLKNNAWNHVDYVYWPSLPFMTNPAPSSHLTTSSQTFNWNAGSGPVGFELKVGTTGKGSTDIYDGGGILGNSASVTGIPTTAGTLYVRLYYRQNSVWKYIDYTYTTGP